MYRPIQRTLVSTVGTVKSVEGVVNSFTVKLNSCYSLVVPTFSGKKYYNRVIVDDVFKTACLLALLPVYL